MDIQEFRCCFGSNLRRLRKLKNITQAELAEIIGLETHNLNRIENGKSFPQLKTIVNIITYFDVAPYELFIDKNEKFEMIMDLLVKNPNRADDIYKVINALTSDK